MPRGFSTFASTLRLASQNNRTIVNFWSPGYKIEKLITTDGKKNKIKTFVPTSTFEAAVAFLKNQYGAKKYLQYKDDIHPGHVSLETRSNYLSVGTMDEIENIGLGTNHMLVHTDSFIEDVLAFRRYPESRLDLYKLNSLSIDEAIIQFKQSEKLYSIIGDRLGLVEEGESCATAAYLCLSAGFIEELLRPQQRLIGRHSVLTPALLAEYVALARKKEFRHSEKSVLFSQEFEQESKLLAEQLKIQLDKLSEIEKNRNEPTPPALSV